MKTTASINNYSETSTLYRLLNYFIAFFAVIPLIFLFKLINEYSLNLPYMDDWDAILNFLSQWKNASFTHKINLLLSQHNEHRIFSSRLIYVIYYNLFGEINFKNLIYLANLQLVVIAGILIYFAKKLLPNFWGIAAVIISLCVFDATGSENSNFSMSGMQNYGVWMFFLLSLFFYHQSYKRNLHLLLALLFQFLCAFSSGNGFMAGICLLLFVFLQRKKWPIIICSSGFVFFTALYFMSYKSSSQNMQGHQIEDMMNFFLKLVGSHFGYENRILIAVILLLLFFASILYKERLKTIVITKSLHPFFSIALFIFFSVTSISIFRSGVGAKMIDHDSYSSRYLIYAHLFSALVLLLVAYRLKKLSWKWGFFAVGLVLFINAYKSNYAMGEKGFERANYRLNTSQYYYPDSTKAKAIAIECCEKNIYCIEDNR